jgi:phospholipid-binding lipoprotein MlaA
VGWGSARSRAGLLFGVLALAVGGCGSILRSDALLLAQVSAVQDDPEAADPVSPIPVIVSRQAGPWSGGVRSAAEFATEGEAEPMANAAPAAPAASAPAEVPTPEHKEVFGPPAPDGATSVLLDNVEELGPPPDLDTAVVLAFEPIPDATLVRIMLGLREWPSAVAQATAPAEGEEPVEYDPWEPFNERMFEFNLDLDKYVIKPVARVWDKVIPDEVKLMISRGFDNVRTAARIVNNLLQAKWSRAGTEAGRFLINTTLGFGGLWDIARQEFGIERPDAEDLGQTLGVWGLGPGPYLVLPFFAPSTVRDFIGRIADGFMNPVSWFTPFIGSIGLVVGDTINDRALNLELFQGFEETTIDFYSAVRNAYLSRRARQIRD